ncbi:MAG: penicillin-binding protein 2 [Parachlamydiaceae bacterium]|nr:penicillin-binding protein 2 [Parachlamydiaceae bacterium]
MSQQPKRSVDKKRLLWVALTIFALFSFLIAHFYMIQIKDGEKWSQQGEKQHYFIVKEPFKRGVFYSNTDIKKGHPKVSIPFVIDVPKFHLYVDPLSIPTDNKDEIVSQLLSYLDISIDERLNLHHQFDKKSHSRKLAMWIDKDKHQQILKWWNTYSRQNKIPRNSIFFVQDYQRSYPFGKLLGQVLHTIQSNKDEKTHQALPTGGLELYFNSYLKGRQGKRRLQRSPRNSFETGDVIYHPENGSDIYLTINHYLQAIAEEEVEKGVKKAKAKAGWAVMMDPRTGEILALAQYPFFNPPEYQFYFNDTSLIENTKVKAVTDANEPGSVFKPFTVTLALIANKELSEKGEKELFSPDEKISTSSGRFPGRSKPIVDTTLHQYLNMDMGMQKSSNVYMGRLAERIINRLGSKWYRKQLNEVFGFGEKTRLELPAESAGVLPTPGKHHPSGALEWSVPTPFSLAMGHNIQVTSPQILRAYAVFANGGYLVQPTLVRKIVKKDNDGVEHIIVDNTTEERIKNFPRVLDEKLVNRLVESMRYVTKPGGTALKADIPGYTEAGKTSTAKKIVNGMYSERQYVSTFAGFTPINNPAFVLVVIMDEPEYGYIPGVGKNHHGGNCTANVFREIAKRSLEYLGIPPDDPFGYPIGDPRRDATKADWMNETRRLQEIYDKWNKSPEIKSKKSA